MNPTVQFPYVVVRALLTAALISCTVLAVFLRIAPASAEALSNQGVKQSGTAATAVWPPQIVTPIALSGAKCDGTTDDTAVLNFFLRGLPNGTTVAMRAGEFCLLQSGNLSIPTGVVIAGSGRAVQPGATPGSLTGSGFVLYPAYTISMGMGSGLENLGIWRSGLVANPSAAQVVAAVTQWGAEPSVGVTIPANIGGVRLDNLFIEGFNTAIHAYAGEIYMNEIWGDDYNGIVISGAGDNTYVNNSRFEPFYSFGIRPPNLAWNRLGVAFEGYGGDTGLYFSHDFALCWQNGVLIDGIGVSDIDDLAVESCATQGGVQASTGVRFINNNAATSLHDSFISGYSTGVSVESGDVAIHDVYISSPAVAAFYLAGGYANPLTLRIGGNPAAGDSVTETFNSRLIAGSPLSVSYMAASGDTPAMVARGLQRAINASQPLVAARSSASVSGAVVKTNWPADISVHIITSTTGGIVAQRETGSAITPGSGIISGAKTNSLTVPMFVVGNSAAQALAWTIANPVISNGTARLPPGWLSVPKIGNGSIRLLTLSGIQWSRVFPINLSSCGVRAEIAAGSTDGDGTITEGIKATGCTLRFTTPFYEAPECLITGPTHVVLDGYRTTATQLSISHAPTSRAKFTYRCRPL